MDWPERKQNYHRQPPDKKVKPKYIAKEEAQGQNGAKVESKVSPPETHKKVENNNEKNIRKVHQKVEKMPKPKFVQKTSTQESSLTCLICSEGIRKRQPIWTCQSCCISLHLKCIKVWIKKTNENLPESEKRKFLLTWNCIQCKTQYKENMPEYYCFCGKFKDPEPDRDLEPHSCGKPCQRKRGPFCPHLCPQLCHSGKCAPCEHEGEIVKCNCGKTERMAKCSEQRAVFQCGKKCQKTLKCGKHKCQRNCHYGDCYPCKKKHMVSCHCGKNQDVVDCDQKSYACGQVCEKLLDCGYHKCEKDCHVGPCGSCTKTPELQKTCPCGRYELMMISENDRQSCKDPIPSCGMPCKKKLSCGHECPRICHEGRCGDCKVIVQQFCRCGTVQRKIECYKAKETKETFLCDHVCKKKKNCGIHVCNTECCPFKGISGPQGHICELNCQRMLNCNKHTCDLPCHAGNCKKCPVIYSQPQPCPCGSTSLKPPIICGTVTPECDNPCNKTMPCGHKCLQLCHYGPCRCYEEVDVVCRCGKQKIRTTCGKQALCLNKCQNLLKCGHKCLVQCHSGSCQEANKEGCFKKCEKERSDCGHKCKQICHFGKKCQEFPCEAQILIKCQCGHRQASVICGAQGSTQGMLKKKQILCNKKCENIKRFDIIYKGKEIYYSNALMQYGFKNFTQLQKIEQRLQKFISESDQHFIEIEFKQVHDHTARLALHSLFQNHYHLSTHFFRHQKGSLFTLSQTENTMLPKPTLSQYIKQVSNGTIKRVNLPFEYTVRFEGESREKVESILNSLRQHYLHKYYVERKDKSIYIHFWNLDVGKDAQYFLQNANQMVHFVGEENAVLLEEQEEVLGDEIVEAQVPLNEKKQVKQTNQDNQDTKVQGQSEKKQEKQETQQSEEKKEPKKEQENQEPKTQKEQGDKKEVSQQQKPKPTNTSSGKGKLIIRKGAPNFVRSPFPPSSENVEDIYMIDDDELFGDKVDWDKVVKTLLDKKMGIEASEWRIRSLLMIQTFHPIDDKIFHDQFTRIHDLYEKDKEKARRILQIQKLDTRKIQQQMKDNQIYLSDHQPEILSYILLHNHFSPNKIELQVSEECALTRQIQRALELISYTEKGEYEEFYNEVKNGDYLLNCVLIPFVHEIRGTFLKTINDKRRVPIQRLYQYLLFDNQEQLIDFAKKNGIQLGKRYSKSKKIEEYTLASGELNKEIVNDNNFLSFIHEKRDKKYFLTEPRELVNDKWMTRSFFAFGDFKQSISPKYMLNLCKTLKE